MQVVTLTFGKGSVRLHRIREVPISPYSIVLFHEVRRSLPYLPMLSSCAAPYAICGTGICEVRPSLPYHPTRDVYRPTHRLYAFCTDVGHAGTRGVRGTVPGYAGTRAICGTDPRHAGTRGVWVLAYGLLVPGECAVLL